MAIRRQFFEYDNAGGALANNASVNIFAGLTKAAETKATEFVVITDFGASPVAYEGLDYTVLPATTNTGCYIQIVIATTGYFVRPDGITGLGVHSWAVPYPPQTNYQGDVFDLTPDVYVLPGQNWNVVLTIEGAIVAGEYIRAYCSYTLYDNADSQFAVELYKNSISVTPENVEWYKRKIIEQGGQ